MNAPIAASRAATHSAPARIAAFGAEEAMAHEAAWRALARRSLDRNPFWEPAFALPAAALPGVAPPLFVAAWRGERMTALLALARPGKLAPVLRGWSHDQAVLGAPLLDRDHGAEDLDALLGWLRLRHPLAQALLLPWIGEDDAMAAAVGDASPTSPARLDPHERAALRPGVAADGAISAKRRKEFARLRRRLGERGVLQSVSATTPEDVGRACACFAALEKAGWKGGRKTAFAQDPGRLDFLIGVTQRFAREGACRIDRLILDGETIAAGIVLGGGPRALYWKTTYDERFAAFSPGVLLTLDVTGRQAQDASVQLTDSCAVADHPMIDRIWAGRIRIADWWIPLGPASPALLAAERARRALRGAAKRMLGRA